MRARLHWVLASVLVVGCAKSENDDAPGLHDSAPADTLPADAASDSGSHPEIGDASDSASAFDTTTGTDTGKATDTTTGTDSSTASDTDTATDTGTASDTGSVIDSGAVDTTPPPPDTTSGPITGGPCLSGSVGATAFRIKFIDGGGRASVSYEVDGLPDKSRWKAGAYGYTIGFTPSYVDPFLGEGGLQLDGSDFVDVELSTVGLSTIRSVTLSIYGRSYDTTTSGSFNWMTFVDSGATASDFVSNVAPYRWYSADATTAFKTGDGGALLRIKAGPSSGSLVVHRIELCMDAD